MKSLVEQLRDADPVESGEGLSAADVAAMRRRVLADVSTPGCRLPRWSRAAAMTAVALLALVGGTRAARQPARLLQQPLPAAPAAGAPAEPRQLQFATPGGTRIIWVFDPDFSLQETVP